MESAAYDPYARGPFSVVAHTFEALDRRRNRRFPCEIWYPAGAGEGNHSTDAGELCTAPAGSETYPLVVFSHFSGGNRRSSSFLCDHLASYGYVVAAMDHSEVVAPELSARAGESASERARRVDAVIAARVPDVQFLLDYLLAGQASEEVAGLELDAARIGLVGHSFGGWTVLATPEIDPRVQSVVALAPGGSSHPLPGVLPLQLTFAWGREVPTLYLAAENDVPIPLRGVIELFERTPGPKRLIVMRRADHQHFIDDVEGAHEALRAMSLPGEAAWIPEKMRPIAELSSGEAAHRFVQGLTLAHLDATLRRLEAAEHFLSGDIEDTLAVRGIEGFAYG
ncbi:MAG TPA: alpha/beta fold hydrolase [Chloroflexota bacterium]|nr:alpha/beta fold hydrolase [Chloroflexota bacterium]